MRKWEYTAYPLAPPGSPADGESFVARLQTMGNQGWELAAIEIGWAFMKREVVPMTPVELAQRAYQEQATGADVCECGHIRSQHVASGLCLGDATVPCPQACARFFPKVLA